MVFKKRYPQNPVNLSNGRGVRFEDFGNNVGFFVTDDPVTIAEFQACMSAGRGGIELSSPEEHADAVKKKASFSGSPNSSIRERQTSGLVTIQPSPQVPLPQEPVAASPVVADAPKVVEAAPLEPVARKKPTTK